MTATAKNYHAPQIELNNWTVDYSRLHRKTYKCVWEPTSPPKFYAFLRERIIAVRNKYLTTTAIRSITLLQCKMALVDKFCLKLFTPLLLARLATGKASWLHSLTVTTFCMQ